MSSRAGNPYGFSSVHIRFDSFSICFSFFDYVLGPLATICNYL